MLNIARPPRTLTYIQTARHEDGLLTFRSSIQAQAMASYRLRNDAFVLARELDRNLVYTLGEALNKSRETKSGALSVIAATGPALPGWSH